jgi:hypothetical protein
MGLQSFIDKLAYSKPAQSFKNLFSTQTQSKIASASNTALTILTKPFGSIQNFEMAKEKTASQKAGTLVYEGATNALIATTGVNAVGAVVKGGVSALIPTAKTLLVGKTPLATAGKIITATSLGGLGTSQRVRQFASDIIPNVASGSTKVAKVIDTGTGELTTSDVYDAARGVAGGFAGGALIAGGYELYKNLTDDKDKSTLPTSVGDVPKDNPINNGTLPTETGKVDASSPKAITPETQVVSAGGSTKKRRSKPRYTKKTPSVNQRVNVIVSSRSSSVGIKQTKKYLNREMLFN